MARGGIGNRLGSVRSAARLASWMVLAGSGSASAQAVAPAVPAPEIPTFPDLEVRTLSNGAQVLVLSDSLLPWVDVSLMIPGGRAADPMGLEGTAELVASLLTEGTDLRTSEDLTRALDRLGATLSAVVGTDWITVSQGSLTVHVDATLALMAEVLMSPSFPQEEFQRLRRQGVVTLQSAWADPRAAASRVFRRAAYGDHPYGRSESPDRVREIALSDLRAYHRRVFRPDGAMFLVSGDVGVDRVVSLLEARFAGWASEGGGPAAESSLPGAIGDGDGTGPQRLIVHVPGSTRAVIRMGHTLPAGDDVDWAALSLLGPILGGGPGTLLGSMLRDRGWSGSAAAELNRRRGPGLLQIDVEVRAEVADSVVDGVMAVLQRVRSAAPDPGETERLARVSTAALPLRLATSRQAVGQLGRLRLLTDADRASGSGSLEAYARAVRDVGSGDILRVAREHLRPDAMSVVVVGDARLLRPRLATLGPVRVVSLDGGELDLADLSPPVTPLNIDARSLGSATWRYRITIESALAGEMVRTLTRDPERADAITLQSTTTLGPQELSQHVTFDARDFRPLRGAFEMAQGGQTAGAHLEVVDGQIVGARTLPSGSEPFQAPLVPGSLVGEMLEVAVWMADLREGAEWVLPVVQVESGAVAHVRVRVLDRTRVTVPAGRYDAYRVEIQGAQGSQLVHARLAPPHVILRLETAGQPFVMELESEEPVAGG